MMKNNGIKIVLLSLGILTISFVVIRFPLFHLHGMKQWPFILVILCLAVVLISFMLKTKITSIACCISYIIGFFFAYIFQTDGTDIGGSKTNNLWIIWTVIIIMTVAVSGIIDCIMSRKVTK